MISPLTNSFALNFQWIGVNANYYLWLGLIIVGFMLIILFYHDIKQLQDVYKKCFVTKELNQKGFFLYELEVWCTCLIVTFSLFLVSICLDKIEVPFQVIYYYTKV